MVAYALPFVFSSTQHETSIGYFYPALDLSSGADEAPSIIHTQPADETESSLLLRSHNVPSCVLLQRRNQDPDWQYAGIVWGPVQFWTMSWAYIFHLCLLWLACFCFWPEYIAFVYGFAARVRIKYEDTEDKDRQYIFDAPVSQLSRGSVYLHFLISFTLSR